MSYPFVDFDRAVCRTVDHHSNAGRAGIPERPAIDVGNQIRHVCDVRWNNNAWPVLRRQDVELVLLHTVADVPRFAPVFHIYVHRYLINHEKKHWHQWSNCLTWLTSTAERVGLNKTLPVRSRLSDLLTGATRRAPRPEKTDWLCEEQLGFGTAKAVIASRGCDGACLHAVGSLAGAGS